MRCGKLIRQLDRNLHIHRGLAQTSTLGHHVASPRRASNKVQLFDCQRTPKQFAIEEDVTSSLGPENHADTATASAPYLATSLDSWFLLTIRIAT